VVEMTKNKIHWPRCRKGTGIRITYFPPIEGVLTSTKSAALAMVFDVPTIQQRGQFRPISG
jgi:hypothetical protein